MIKKKSNIRFDEGNGKCGYCLKPEMVIRLCRIRYNVGNGKWKEPIWLCDECREYLHGQYKYIKPASSKKSNI